MALGALTRSHYRLESLPTFGRRHAGGPELDPITTDPAGGGALLRQNFALVSREEAKPELSGLFEQRKPHR